MAASILHPLAALCWGPAGQQATPSAPGPFTNCQCALLKGYIYVTASRESSREKLFQDLWLWRVSVTDLTSWIPLTSSLPKVGGFALTTYQSRLLLVGGCSVEGELLGNLWESIDGTSWEQSLPPMPTPRYGAAAASTGGYPEHLIVVGGFVHHQNKNQMTDKVEVLMGGEWSSLSPFPERCDNIRITIHNGNVYVYGGRFHIQPSYYKLQSLLATRDQTHGKVHPPWKKLAHPDHIPVFALVSLGGYLIAFLWPIDVPYCHVEAYSPATQSWVELGKTPSGYYLVEQVVTGPSGELLVFGHGEEYRIQILKADVRGTV